METSKLKKFAQFARRSLIEQVSNKLDQVLNEDSAARRESSEAIKKLEEAIKNQGKEQVIERVAYTWFNRFCALRFMDVNRYTRIGVVSPAEGQFQPELLADLWDLGGSPPLAAPVLLHYARDCQRWSTMLEEAGYP